jgi:hypothetical protein
MTATLKQTPSDLLKAVNLLQQGKGAVIASQGRAVDKLGAVPPSTVSPSRPGVPDAAAAVAQSRRCRQD